jgi:hypothetical protein
MKIGNRLIAGALAGLMIFSAVLVPVMAGAQTKAKDAKRERTHRVTSAALGAAGVYLLGRRNTTLGVAALAGSAYEAKRMQDSVNNRHKRQRASAYRRGYRNGQVYAMNHSRTRTGGSHYVWVRGKDGKRHKVLVKGRAWAATRGKKVGWSKNGKG